MSDPENPIGLAYRWVARIFAVVLVMFVPGLGGQWLDRRLGTQFIALLGFGLGLVGGMAYLIAATRAEGMKRPSPQGDPKSDVDEHDNSKVGRPGEE